MTSKQLGKLRQWAGEVISSSNKTTVTDEFQELEQDIEQRKVGAQKLLLASKGYHHVLSKKKDNEALDGPDKLLPVDTLGVVMIVHGEEFGDDSAFGTSLVKLGRAHCKIATLQEAYALTFQDTYFASLEQYVNEVKEYEQQRKRLESRRLSYDAALSKQEKLKNSKKEKDKREADDEAERAQARYEEASEDVRAYMHAIQENEIDQLRELTNFLDIEMNFVKQYLDVLQETHAEWSSTSEVVPRKAEGPMHTFSSRSPKLPSRSPKLPKRTPTLNRSNSTRSNPSTSKAEVSLESSDEEAEDRPITPSRRLSNSTHKRSDSTGTAKTPSRPSSRTSRHRSDSTATTGDDKSIRKNVAGWMGSVRGKKSKFASLQDDEAEPVSEKETASMTTRFGSLGRKASKSKGSDAGVESPKDRILKPPSLQKRKVVRALYDFNGSSDELSFKVGDEIAVVNEVLDEWWMGNLHGKQGLFPTSYTEPLSTQPAVMKRTKAGKALEEDVYSAPVDSGDEDSPDGGYRTSDLEVEDAYKSRPLVPSHSPFFGGPPDHASISSADEEERTIAPSISRHGHSDAGLIRAVPPPPPVRRSSTTDLAKKAPPPPPPRRTPTSTPRIPPRPPLSNASSSSSLLSSQRPADTPMSSGSSFGYDASPFDSSADLSTANCTSFKQNPFKPKGMCANCFEYHSGM